MMQTNFKGLFLVNSNTTPNDYNSVIIRSLSSVAFHQ